MLSWAHGLSCVSSRGACLECYLPITWWSFLDYGARGPFLDRSLIAMIKEKRMLKDAFVPEQEN